MISVHQKPIYFSPFYSIFRNDMLESKIKIWIIKMSSKCCERNLLKRDFNSISRKLMHSIELYNGVRPCYFIIHHICLRARHKIQLIRKFVLLLHQLEHDAWFIAPRCNIIYQRPRHTTRMFYRGIPANTPEPADSRFPIYTKYIDRRARNSYAGPWRNLYSLGAEISERKVRPALTFTV